MGQLIRDPIDLRTLDRFTGLAARVLDVPVVYLTLMDDTCGKVVTSVGVREPIALGISLSLMNLMVASHHPVLVTDGWIAPPEATSAVAAGRRPVAILAEIALVASDDRPVGTLTVMGWRPRRWSAPQREFLKELAIRIVGEVDIGPTARRM